ncbi:hypothetical protein Barb4_01184 [Bacteroidales bacterium Barb4]|nr:hypothetical protein Barb4_01184 [Bacteroidales bacterium Barb4]
MDSYKEAKAKRNEAFKKDLDAFLKKWDMGIDVDLGDYYRGSVRDIHIHFESLHDGEGFEPGIDCDLGSYYECEDK